jgi:RHS repeat-associated protein
VRYIYNTGHNNGRVAQTIDNTLGETVNYGYDYLHRLTAATATNGTWGEAYTYDGFGNLTGKTPTQGYAPAMTGSADSNATGGALNGQWDVEKRPMTQAATQGPTFYVYDPWGRRVWRQWYDTTYGTTNCEAYFYGATGQKLESYSCTYSATSLSATLQGINTYFAGKMLSEKGVFIATDRLGSVRGDSNGVSMSYFPWGEERGQGTTDGRTKFASYYRDMPGQDYANARYYSASSGSFWSPDPKGNGAADTAYASGMAASYTPGLGAARPDNPMSWNRYMYSLGDPINFFDPIGKDSCDADGTDCDDGDDPDCGNALSPCPADTGGGDVVFSTTVTSTPWVWPITVPDLSTLTDLLAGALAEIGTVAGTVGQTALGAVAVFALTPSTSGTDTLHTASGVPTPQELVGTCTLISTVVEPSTNSRNKGGTSIEQVYQCPDGSVWVVHTLKDKNGGTFDSPHIRKWPKQGQAK